MVPVLSNTTVCTWWAVSKALPPLINTPFCAPIPVPTITAVGAARPRAQGHATTSTEIAIMRLKVMGFWRLGREVTKPQWVKITHRMKVNKLRVITTGTKTPEMRSANLVQEVLGKHKNTQNQQSLRPLGDVSQQAWPILALVQSQRNTCATWQRVWDWKRHWTHRKRTTVNTVLNLNRPPQFLPIPTHPCRCTWKGYSQITQFNVDKLYQLAMNGVGLDCAQATLALEHVDFELAPQGQQSATRPSSHPQ